MLVAIAFGLDPAWGMLTVPLIAFVAGFGWACFGIAVAGYAKSIENFSYIVSAVLTPLFLVAGTFFPLDRLPRWAQVLGEINPLHHCVVARAPGGVRLRHAGSTSLRVGVRCCSSAWSSGASRSTR